MKNRAKRKTREQREKVCVYELPSSFGLFCSGCIKIMTSNEEVSGTKEKKGTREKQWGHKIKDESKKRVHRVSQILICNLFFIVLFQDRPSTDSHTLVFFKTVAW